MKKLGEPSLPLSASDPWWLAGLFLTPLRWVMGWFFFSAMWRRIVLEYKLDPSGPGYVGEKINHFLPQALLVGPLLERSLDNPNWLYLGLWFFTLVEGLVGIALLLGLATRFAGLVLTGLSFGILLGSGWLGTTCLDEWQIGCLGVVSGLLLILAGGGPLSGDAWLARRFPNLASGRVFPLVASGNLPLNRRGLQGLVLAASLGCLALTLWTNQVFHGGVWGPLHNKSVKPHVAVTNTSFTPDGALTFTVFRDEGVDTYGAFIVAVELVDPSGKMVQRWDAAALSAIPPGDIRNRWLVKVKAKKDGLELPLGGQAQVRLRLPDNQRPNSAVWVILHDVSGATWSVPVSAATP